MRFAIGKPMNGPARREVRLLHMVPPRLLCIALAIALMGTIISLSAAAAVR